MLTRFVRIQLAIFVVVGLAGLAVMVFGYLRAPALLGVGRISVTLELPSTGGLYRFGNVTYRGVQIGEVTETRAVGGRHVEATLSLRSRPSIPAGVIAEVRSMSAIGEQYVDLEPTRDGAPYLRDGSVIPMSDARVPQQVGPMLDRLNALVSSIPGDRFGPLLDETSTAFRGAADDFGSILDSSSTILRALEQNSQHIKRLVDDGAPLLDAQARSTPDFSTWTRSLAGVTGQLVDDDPQIRRVLSAGPPFAREVSQLLEQIEPTLPVLLANLTTVGQIAVTYNPSLEQLLVLFPPSAANYQGAAPANNPTGQPLGDFALVINDPPPCTVGFLPQSSWRSPADTTDVDAPDDVYCKLPQDSPLAVRGARNYPCMGHPGKRAPTVEICDSPEPYEPLAMRQHTLGPSPLDPNLIAQGVGPDSRILPKENITAPIAGTPPPGAAPLTPPPAPDGGVPPAQPAAAPAAFGPKPLNTNIGAAQYDPTTGQYMGPDGHLYADPGLRTAGDAHGVADILLPAG